MACENCYNLDEIQTPTNLYPYHRWERSNSSLASSVMEDLSIPSIYIRDVQKNDLTKLSDIITASFFSINILSWPTEWLKTFLSLEDSYSAIGNEYCMFVACDACNDSIIGFCEIDSRLTSKPIDVPRPYMCNLAIDKEHRRKGIAKVLIRKCEEQAIKWKNEAIYLRVRRSNDAALELYKGMQYEETESNKEKIDRLQTTKEEVVLLKKNLMT